MKHTPNLSNQKGSALGLVMTTLLTIGIIMFQLSYTSIVTSTLATNYRNQSVAYRMAQSALSLQLLRLNIFQKAKALRSSLPGGGDGIPESVLDSIWNVPFAFPPPSIPGITGGQADMIKKFVDTTAFKGSARYFVSAESVSGKINLNDILIELPEGQGPNTPETKERIDKLVAAISQKISDQIVSFIENKKASDENFRRLNPNLQPLQLINEIEDFIDRDNESRQGGEEPFNYPNRAFLSMAELRSVRGMEDSVFQMLDSTYTVFRGRGINVNSAQTQVFNALFPAAAPEEIAELIKARDDLETGSPWSTVDSFWSSVETALKGTRIEEVKKDLADAGVDLIVNDNAFIIRARGEFSNASRTIMAVVLDPSPPPIPPPAAPNPDGTATPPRKAEPARVPPALLRLPPPIVFIRTD